MVKLTLAELASDRSVQMGVVAFVGALGTQVRRRRSPAQQVVFQLGFLLVLAALLRDLPSPTGKRAASHLSPKDLVRKRTAEAMASVRLMSDEAQRTMQHASARH